MKQPRLEERNPVDLSLGGLQCHTEKRVFVWLLIPSPSTDPGMTSIFQKDHRDPPDRHLRAHPTKPTSSGPLKALPP